MAGWKQNANDMKKRNCKTVLFFISLYNNYFSGAAASTGFFSRTASLLVFSAGTSAASFFGVTSGSCSLTFLGRPLFGFSAGTFFCSFPFFTLLDLVWLFCLCCLCEFFCLCFSRTASLWFFYRILSCGSLFF